MSDLGEVKPVELEEGLTQRAYREIRRAILSGGLEAGSRTSVRALSEALGISRTPVREALVDLANDRLIVFERNRGVQICVTQRHDIEEIFELRLLLEVPAVRRAIETIDGDRLAELRASLDGMCASLDDEAAFMDKDWTFHRTLLDATENGRLVAFVESLRNQTRMRGISTVGRSRSLQAIVGQHEAIHAAAERNDADGAAAAMTDHLQTTRDLLLAQEPQTNAAPDQEEDS